MKLAQLILDLFEPDEDAVRTWVSTFDRPLENSIYWKQSLDALTHELEQQLRNYGHTQRPELWVALASVRPELSGQVWSTAHEYGVSRSIDANDASSTDGALDALFVDDIDSEATLQSRRIVSALRSRRLYGRDDEFTALSEVIETHRSGRVLLRGPTGFGKSMVLAHWAASLPARNVCVIQHFFSRLYETSASVQEAYVSLYDQVCRVAGRKTPRRTRVRPRDALAAELSRDRSPANPLVVVLDGLDEADEAMEPFVGLGECVFVVASIRTPSSAESMISSPWLFTPDHQLTLGPIGIAEIERWVRDTMPLSVEPDVTASRLAEMTSGVPVELRFLLDELVAAGHDGVPGIQRVSDVQPSEGFVEHCRQQLLRLENGVSNSVNVWRLFAVLAHARGPIPEQELVSMTGVAGVGELRRLPASVARWLAVAPRFGVSFESGRLARVFRRIIDQAPAMQTIASDARQLLVEHCRRWKLHLGRYALNHLPAHLLDAGALEAARDSVLDTEFLRARLTAEDDPRPMVKRTTDDLLMLGAAGADSPSLRRMSAFWSTHSSVMVSHAPSFGRTGVLQVFEQLAIDLGLVPDATSTSPSWRIRAGRPVSSSPTLQRQLHGHRGPIVGALELERGRLLSWGVDCTLRLWSADGAECQVLDGHESGVAGAIALRGDRVLSWANEPHLRLWESSGTCTVLEGHSDWVLGALVISDDRVLSWSHDGTLRIWRAGNADAELVGHRGSVVGAVELPDRRLLSWGTDGTLRLWLPTGVCDRVIRAHGEPVFGAKRLESDRIVSWSQDGMVRVWSAEGGLIAELRGSPSPASSVVPSPSGDLVCWSFSGSFQVLDEFGRLQHSVRAHERWMAGLAVLPDTSVLTWSYDQTIRLWDSNGILKAVFSGHTGVVRDVLVLSGGKGFLSWGDDDTLRLWGRDGSRGHVLHGQSGWGLSGASALSGNRILSWGRDGILRVWNAASSDREEQVVAPVDDVVGSIQLEDGHLWSWGHSGSVSLWRPDGVVAKSWDGKGRAICGALALRDQRLLSWAEDGDLTRWSTTEGPVSAPDHDGGCGALELSDGRVVSWGGDASASLWTSEGEHERRLEGHTADVLGAIELCDGSIVTWSADRTVRKWSRQGDSTGLVHHPYGALTSACSLPGGGWATWGRYNRIFVWDSDGSQRQILDGHQDGVVRVMLLRDGRLLSISLDRTLRLWSLVDGSNATLSGHRERVVGAKQLRDGRIVSWSDDRTLRLWSELGEAGPCLEGHRDWINGVLELPTGLLTFGMDGTLRAWGLNGKAHSMWVCPGGSSINQVLPHAEDPHVMWVVTRRAVMQVTME